MAFLAGPKTRIAFFELTGTMLFTYGVVCSSIEGYPSDFFVSCALYLAIGWASDFSGAHFNPTISLAMYLHNKFDYLWIYLTSQMFGGILGAFAAYVLTEKTLPTGEGLTVQQYAQFACKEIVGGFLFAQSVLMVANKNTAFTRKTQYVQVFVPVALFICRFLAGNVGINPAIDFGALLTNTIINNKDMSHFWIPVLSPLVGGVIAGLFHKYLYEPSVCLSRVENRAKPNT